jgi:hypothetical protein
MGLEDSDLGPILIFETIMLIATDVLLRSQLNKEFVFS